MLSAIAAPALAAQQASKIRVAMIGGSHSHAFEKGRILNQSGEWELVGVAEKDEKVAERYMRAGIKHVSIEEILRDSSIKAVAVESAVRDHFRHALLALEAGKHVHLEKPPADTLDGMRQLVALAKKKNLLLQSGYMWRYHPGMIALIEAARQGWLGEVYLVRGQIGTLIEANRRPEWGEFPGGHMFELCAHLIDVTTRLMGRPQKVTPFLRHDASLHDKLMDNTVVIFEYGKAMAILSGATMQPGAGRRRMFEVQGTNGVAIVSPIEPPEVIIDLAQAAGPYKKGEQKLPMPEYKRYFDDLAEFAAAIRGEKKLRVSLDEEMLVQETLLRASGMS
jgi:predicted dehydrogenase